MAAIFCSSANLVNALSTAAPGPFFAVSNLASTITVNVAAGPAGNNTVTFAASGGNNAYLTLQGQVSATNGLITGFGLKFAAAPSGQATILRLQGSGGGQPLLSLTAGGALQYTDSSGSYTGAALSTAIRHYVEVYVPLFNASSTVQINVDGIPYLTIAGNNTAVYPIQVNVGAVAGATGLSIDMDSWYLTDDQGTTNNTLKGIRVVTDGISAGVGAITNYTPVGAATSWQAVSDIPPDSDTSYAQSSVVNDQLAVVLSAIPNLASVDFVNVEAFARQEQVGGGRTLGVGVGNGAIQTYGGAQSLTTSYVSKQQVFDINPLTGAPWTLGDLTTLQAAVKTVT